MDSNIHPQLINAVNNYKIPALAVDLLKKHPPLLIAGVSAAGKDTVAKEIVRQSNWRRVISHTNRPLREGERSGENYWFVSDADILELINTQKFIDVKVVHEVKIYGTTIDAYQKVVQSGGKPMLVIDVQGIKNIAKYLPPSYCPIFILPPDFNSWIERMKKQGPTNNAEHIRRLRSAKAELEEVIADERYLLFVNRKVSTVANEIMADVVDNGIQKQNRKLARQLLKNIETH